MFRILTLHKITKHFVTIELSNIILKFNWNKIVFLWYTVLHYTTLIHKYYVKSMLNLNHYYKIMKTIVK